MNKQTNLGFEVKHENIKKNPQKCASFSRIFIFLSEHFSCKEKIYIRNSLSMASKNCPNYSAFIWNRCWSILMNTLDFISFRVYPPPLNVRNRDLKHFRVVTFLIVNKTLSDNFSLVHTWLKYNKQAKKSRFWSPNIKISRKVLKNVHHFPAFSFFKTSLFLAEKKSIGDMVHRWLLNTAYIILLSN